jgi:hypothetical protein
MGKHRIVCLLCGIGDFESESVLYEHVEKWHMDELKIHNALMECLVVAGV